MASTDHPGADGVTRRQVLLGGAVAGGAVWATPAVQVIGMSSAHAQSASGPPPTTPPTTCKDISNIQVVVFKLGKHYGLKYDPGDSALWEDWSSAAPDSNDCIRYFEHETGHTVVARDAVADRFNEDARVILASDCEWRLSLPLPAGYVFVAGYIKAGSAESGCPSAQAPGADYVAFISS